MHRNWVLSYFADDSCRRREQFRRSLMNTPGRETFYLVWIEYKIACRNHITRLIIDSFFHHQTAHYLVPGTRHQCSTRCMTPAFRVRRNVAKHYWLPSPHCWTWGRVIFVMTNWSSLEERCFKRCCCSRRHFMLAILWSRNDRESPDVHFVSRLMGGFILWVQSRLCPRITFHHHQPEPTEWRNYSWMRKKQRPIRFFS